MKKIIFLSPITVKSKFQTGLEIRFRELEQEFKKWGFEIFYVENVKRSIVSKSDFFYTPISTNKLSIGHQFISSNQNTRKLIIDLYTPLLLEKDASISLINPLHHIVRQQKKALVRRMLEKGSHYLVANHRQRDYWLDLSIQLGYKINKKQVSIVPTGVPKLKAIKSKQKNKKVIAWFGGIYPWMNPTPLVDAFALIAKKYPNWKLRFIGGFLPGSGYEKLYQQIVKLTKSKIPSAQLEFLPWQKPQDLPDSLADVAFAVYLAKPIKNDILAHGSRWLSVFNLSVPYLFKANDVISDIAIKYGAAKKISSDNSEISKKLIELIENPEKIKEMSKNALKIQSQYIETELDYENLINFLRNNENK